jgi:hypothetical protein
MTKTEHLTLLRATVNGDFAQANELSKAFPAAGLDDYGEVIGAAFLLAVRMQFPQRYTPEDVIHLVADTRALLDRTGDLIDPRAAELVVRSALGEEGLSDDLSDAVVVGTQIAVCSVLAHQGKLGDPDAFVVEVEKVLDEWAKDD